MQSSVGGPSTSAMWEPAYRERSPYSSLSTHFLLLLLSIIALFPSLSSSDVPSEPLTAHASTQDGLLHLSLAHSSRVYRVSLAGLPAAVLSSTELLFTISEQRDPTHVVTVPVNPNADHDHDHEHDEDDGRVLSLSRWISIASDWSERDDPIWLPPPIPDAELSTSQRPSTKANDAGNDQSEEAAEDEDEEDDSDATLPEPSPPPPSTADRSPPHSSSSSSSSTSPASSRSPSPSPSVRFPSYAAGVQPLLSLVMIVKNEALGIEATLQSTYGHVDHYCILDTGSTDGTLELIRAFFATLPSSVTHDLFQEAFVDFSTTRNRALLLTGNSTEFVLMLNGDDRLVGGAEMRKFLETRRGMTAMDEAIYIVPVDYGGMAMGRSERLARTRNHFVPDWPNDPLNHWRFEGVTHEAYVCNKALHSGAQIIYTTGDFRVYHDITFDTAENKDRRFELDIDLLQADLQAHPDSLNAPRNMYYLAQSYYNLNRLEEAEHWYTRRVSTNYVRPTPWGEDNEKHRSYGLLAYIADKLHKDHKLAESYWKKSWDACPAAYSLYSLAKSMRDRGEYTQAKKLAEKARKVLTKGSPVVCNGDDGLVEKSLPMLLRSLASAQQQQAD